MKIFVILAVALFTSVLSEDPVTNSTQDTTLNGSTSSLTIDTSNDTTSSESTTSITTLSTEASTNATEASTNATEASNNTTLSTETTTISTVTTDIPTNTTLSTEASTIITKSTEAPTQSTASPTQSTAAPTSSEAPITSTVVPPVPAPDDCSWNVTEADVTCIRASMKAQFVIENEGKKSYINLGCNATFQNSDCSPNGTQVLVLSEEEKYVLTMVFAKASDKFSVKNITLEYTLPDGKHDFVSNDANSLFNVKVGNSYLCKSNIDVKLGNVTMKISNIHIQAFAEKDKDFGTAEECDADDVVSDMIPIAVGVILVTLVVVVLIAYLIGRRRSQQRGYQNFKE